MEISCSVSFAGPFFNLFPSFCQSHSRNAMKSSIFFFRPVYVHYSCEYFSSNKRCLNRLHITRNIFRRYLMIESFNFQNFHKFPLFSPPWGTTLRKIYIGSYEGKISDRIVSLHSGIYDVISRKRRSKKNLLNRNKISRPCIVGHFTV